VVIDGGENNDDDYGDGGSPFCSRSCSPHFFVTTCGKIGINI
jgi:hypothetical protein